MKISAITNVNNNRKTQNFGKFIRWVDKTAQKLNDLDVRDLSRVVDYLDIKQSKHINYIFEIADAPFVHPSEKVVRIVSKPRIKEMHAIQKNSMPDATFKDYERYSKWFPLNGEFKDEAAEYLDRQISYIRACVNNPVHSSNHISK